VVVGRGFGVRSVVSRVWRVAWNEAGKQEASRPLYPPPLGLPFPQLRRCGNLSANSNPFVSPRHQDNQPALVTPRASATSPLESAHLICVRPITYSPHARLHGPASLTHAHSALSSALSLTKLPWLENAAQKQGIKLSQAFTRTLAVNETAGMRDAAAGVWGQARAYTPLWRHVSGRFGCRVQEGIVNDCGWS
jgi:hypothetical protein